MGNRKVVEGLRSDWRNKCGDGSNVHSLEVNPFIGPPPKLPRNILRQRTRDELMRTSRSAYLLMNERAPLKGRWRLSGYRVPVV